MTSNNHNKFNAQKNLLILYTHSDIKKASSFGKRLLLDIDEYPQVHKKDVHFMLGNVSFLEGEYGRAKDFYRNTLKMGP